MKAVHISALILVVACLTGCAETSLSDNAQFTSAKKLDQPGSVYVALPADGQYGTEPYPGSGEMVVQAIKSPLLRHVAEVDDGKGVETLAAARASARQAGTVYLIYPTITHWEDRATEWSGLPDRVEVVITVYNVADGGIVDRATIMGKSSWFTFGGDHPQDLLPQPMQKYVDALYS